MRSSVAILAILAAPLAAQQALPNRGAPAAPDSAAQAKVASASAGLRLRSIGPALTSGRIADVAMDPRDKRTWYVATAAGGVWKSTNNGVSFSPIFDGEGSFSIGTITVDERAPSTVWVGTGENNAQRVVAYGDGVYKSLDGGRSWTNMGLKESEHIGRIIVDPRNSDVVYVASQGPLWRKGGDRGVYKTTDGGKTWERVLHVDDWTGANDIQLDPKNPDHLIATMWQRSRRVFGFLGGGPGSGIYRSMDGGKSWNKAQSGFPDEEMGRIGLTVSPVNSSIVYAIADIANGKGGFFRSKDFGASWEKMNSYQTGGNYYNKIFADPKILDRVYAADVILQVTDDGGKTFHRVGELLKHVDNHVVWIDPDENTHLVVGCDGGLYESWDLGKTWKFSADLPVTQYYKVATDDSKPFYKVYGGAQDNFSVGGPSRTRTIHGITNADWFITSGGDGFGSVIDPVDPNTVYAQSQFGNLSRFNLKTGDVMGIQPSDEVTGSGLRWNWDSPLMISPHNHNRLYFAANRLFRSDDRGDSWKAVSPDLSRQIDRNRLKMMDRVQSVDALAKNQSTTLFGDIVTVAESPIKEGLLFTGTDDGRVSISENGGASWRSIDRFPGVPETTFVSRVVPSQFDANTVYATFNNHQSGDFHPYVLKSTDLGRTWTNITADLPARGSVFSMAEDFVDRNLLFVGTEFGLFFTKNGGARWIRVKAGMPTIQVRDIAIQKRESDLVLATFGRGFFILDDYSALRELTDANLAKPAVIFPVRPAPLFIASAPLGLPGVAFQGANYFSAPNPPNGAVFTYFLKDALKSRKSVRQTAEKAAMKKGEDIFYPSWDSLKAEDRSEDPVIVATISTANGKALRRFVVSGAPGINRASWDLQLQPTDPINGPAYQADPEFPFSSPPAAPYVVPGTYQVALSTRIDGVLTPLGDPRRFEVVGVDGPSVRTMATLAEQQGVAELERDVLGTSALMGETARRIGFLKRAIDETANADAGLVQRVRVIENKLKDAQEALTGDPTRARRQEAAPTSLLNRLYSAVGNGWSSSLEPPSAADRQQVEIVNAGFGKVLEQLRTLLEVDLAKLEQDAEVAGVPWTPGRFPRLPSSGPIRP
ncbi:MAG: hypothetical protein JWO05_3014 [Gemmatimonadetes bacterium]|nr:hypothetical protein [Gemmatimonadota bacterium]